MDIINLELEPFPYVDRFGIHCDYYEKDFITPIQYEKRTGEAWPDDGAVYFKVIRVYLHGLGGVEWGVCRWQTARRDHDICVVATEAGPPPDDWRPEEEKANG
jgi:hypothetical protein